MCSYSDFRQFADAYRPRVEAALERFSSGEAGCPERLREAVRYSLLSPGKRLRPLLALMAADACGGLAEVAMPAACAVEMIHAYSLIHDDLPAMDDDDLRRGRPTCHKAFGEAMAILAGDALQAMAFETLAEAPVSDGALREMFRVLARAAGPACLVGGQADDIHPEEIADFETLQSVHLRKTAAMIEASLHLGALSAEADSVYVAALSEYGRRVGLAFQVIDDLLDVSGNEAAVGKRLGKDANLAKKTYPLLLGIEGSRRESRQLIEDAKGWLRVFGDKAAPLRGLATYVLQRER
jgi:geranylgeranyl diphosphate synthase type II